MATVDPAIILAAVTAVLALMTAMTRVLNAIVGAIVKLKMIKAMTERLALGDREGARLIGVLGAVIAAAAHPSLPPVDATSPRAAAEGRAEAGTADEDQPATKPIEQIVGKAYEVDLSSRPRDPGATAKPQDLDQPRSDDGLPPPEAEDPDS